MQFGSESTGPARFLRVVCSGWLTTHGAEIQEAIDRALRRRRDGHRALRRFGVGSIPAPIQYFLHCRWNDWRGHRRSCVWRRCCGLGDEAGRPVIGDLPMGTIPTALNLGRSTGHEGETASLMAHSEPIDAIGRLPQPLGTTVLRCRPSPASPSGAPSGPIGAGSQAR